MNKMFRVFFFFFFLREAGRERIQKRFYVKTEKSFFSETVGICPTEKIISFGFNFMRTEAEKIFKVFANQRVLTNQRDIRPP